MLLISREQGGGANDLRAALASLAFRSLDIESSFVNFLLALT